MIVITCIQSGSLCLKCCPSARKYCSHLQPSWVWGIKPSFSDAWFRRLVHMSDLIKVLQNDTQALSEVHQRVQDPVSFCEQMCTYVVWRTVCCCNTVVGPSGCVCSLKILNSVHIHVTVYRGLMQMSHPCLEFMLLSRPAWKEVELLDTLLSHNTATAILCICKSHIESLKMW